LPWNMLCGIGVRFNFICDEDARWRERRARSEDWQVLKSFQSTKALACLHHAGSRSAQHFRAVPYDSNFGSGRLARFPISLNRWSVMAALVAAIHVYAGRKKVVDARD
jgi:hypothetical protein